ncbi:PPC domain-containing DNA-binding protein [Ammoniphilus sp. YIM 78166]|uniref:PPC domain-containing DNA-binding protein n=1 Tax=Ammoniphilus sp. YIM 78166 TaxID=1644106 RepID=UPI00106F4CF5|nr:PPC domain-containing DNA-binding protein [Ammoniphilus sp. YIM 78166]
MARENHSILDEETGTLWGILTKGTDLMEGILQQCERHGIDAGQVTCIGSLDEAYYVHGVEGPDGKPAYSDPVTFRGPMEILNGTGFLCRDEAGRLDLHFHGLVVDKQGQIRGGHFLKGKNPVLITLEFTVKTSKGIQAVRSFDPELGFPVINYRRK